MSPGAPGLCLSFCLQQSIPQADTRNTAREKELVDRQLAQTHTYIPTSRDMLNIVLGTTLGLNMAVVRFFGDYLDLERYRTENNTREEDWLELSYGRRGLWSNRDCVELDPVQGGSHRGGE